MDGIGKISVESSFVPGVITNERQNNIGVRNFPQDCLQ